MIGEAEIIVGAEVEHLARRAVGGDLDARPLRPGDQPLALGQPVGLDLGERRTQMGQEGVGHRRLHAGGRAPLIAGSTPDQRLASGAALRGRARGGGSAGAEARATFRATYAPAMIPLRNATWRAKAARPARLALTVVRGRLPTNALATST